MNLAKNDLKRRLNESNVTFWHNAVNGARLAMESGKIKEAVIKILEDVQDEAVEKKASSHSKNVILIPVLFNSLTDDVSLDFISEKHQSILDAHIFNTVITFSMQKATYKAIEVFLESEAVS